MDTAFITIVQKLVTEQGKEALFNTAKGKSFLADYTKGEYKKESRLLMQAIESGAAKAIDNTQELQICKLQQIRLLQDDYFITEEMAIGIIDTISFILRGDNTVTSPKDPVVQISENTDENNHDNADIHIQKGRHFIEKEEFEQAIAEFTRAIEFEAFPTHFIDRGLAYSHHGRYNEAISDFTSALNINKALVPSIEGYAFAYRGQAYKQKGWFNEAIPDYTNAINLLHSDEIESSLYVDRGMCYSGRQEYQQAISDFTMAINLEPKDFTFFQRGIAYCTLEDYNSALSDFNEAIHRNSNQAEIYEFRAYTYQFLAMFPAAIADLKRAVTLDPSKTSLKKRLNELTKELEDDDNDDEEDFDDDDDDDDDFDDDFDDDDDE
ncbi:MAG: tetratricopeptide repeat protein [Spirochaetaceae bacterium]|jgi:tetratricopeptide (TPR) repeat protein|nr:tetratricopeptide repeat protein [Spirochaetaceae bacterium]